MKDKDIKMTSSEALKKIVLGNALDPIGAMNIIQKDITALDIILGLFDIDVRLGNELEDSYINFIFKATKRCVFACTVDFDIAFALKGALYERQK